MTDDKMLEFAKAEVARLRAELEKTPAYKRLKAAEDLIAAYLSNPEVVPSPPATNPAATNSLTDEEVAEFVEKHITKTKQVENAAAEYLTSKGRRATSGEILPIVQSKGIHVPGKQPNKTISSYLSTSKRFDNVPGFGGYGLVEWNGRRTAPQVQDNPDVVQTSLGVFN